MSSKLSTGQPQIEYAGIISLNDDFSLRTKEGGGQGGVGDLSQEVVVILRSWARHVLHMGFLNMGVAWVFCGPGQASAQHWIS